MHESELITLNPQFKREPFLALLSDYTPINASLAQKVQCLTDFCIYIEEIEGWVEQEQTVNHWLAIASGFGAAATVACSGTFAPMVGAFLSGTSVIGALSTILGGLLTKRTIEPVVDKLTRYRLALESQEARHWAIIWDMYGMDTFNAAVSYASRGYLSNGKLIQRGSDSPFERAVNYLASIKCKTYDEVISDINQITIASRQSAAMVPSTLPKTQPPLPKFENPSNEAPLLPEQPVPVGQNTKLNAVNVAATQSPSTFALTPKRSAYSLILDNPFQSLAIFGAQRTGKSYLAAIASQELHRRGIPIYVINLARFGEEDDVYWQHCNKAVLGDISSLPIYEASQLIKEAIRTVNEFYSQPQAILIFDEWAYAGNKDNAHAEALEPLLRLVSDKLGTLTSTGIKRGKAIWTIAPEFVAGSMQKPALAVKKSALLYVTIAPGEYVDWRGNKIGFNAELFSQIKNNYTIEKPEGLFNQDRICFLNNEWLEMGDLPPLDKTLRPAIPAHTPPSRTKPQTETERMLATLEAAPTSNLWSFCTNILEMIDPEEIKDLIAAIADLLCQEGNEEIAKKYRIRSPYDVRYSYPGYSKKVAETHRLTGNICCCCGEAESKEAHHTEYFGIEDTPGENLFPVCLDCHKSFCHSKKNWQKADNIWEYKNTPEFVSQLKANTVMLSA